jgi:hypothetical protein
MRANSWQWLLLLHHPLLENALELRMALRLRRMAIQEGILARSCSALPGLEDRSANALPNTELDSE